ncbi:MAG: hypothetical protein JXA74_17420 [Anaerolineae bacterium]|nr:hypothetical protein [Anaerolineae bacterium]
MDRSARLSIAVSLVLLALVISVVLPLPSWDLAFFVLGSELKLTFSGSAQLASLMTAMVAAGVDATLRSDPQHASRSLAYTATFWPVPILITIASFGMLPSFPWWGYQLAFIALTGAILALSMFLQYRSAEPGMSYQRLSRVILNGIIYALALLFLIYFYSTRLRSVLSATGVAVVSGALALDLLRSADAPLARLWLYASLVGLLMGEVTWGLNYLSIDTEGGGVFLFVLFYALSGVSLQHLWGRLSRLVIAEYAAICVANLALLGFLVARV